MANSQYLGTNAGFYYYLQLSSAGSTWRSFALAVPLREPRPSYQITAYVADSLDYSRRQTLVVSGSTNTGAYELVGTMRYNDDQPGLLQFLLGASLNSGSTDLLLRYTTALTTGTSSGGMGPGADCWLIEPMPPLDVSMDRQRASFGDVELTIRVRAYGVNQDFSTDSGARWF